LFGGVGRPLRERERRQRRSIRSFHGDVAGLVNYHLDCQRCVPGAGRLRRRLWRRLRYSLRRRLWCDLRRWLHGRLRLYRRRLYRRRLRRQFPGGHVIAYVLWRQADTLCCPASHRRHRGHWRIAEIHDYDRVRLAAAHAVKLGRRAEQEVVAAIHLVQCAGVIGQVDVLVVSRQRRQRLVCCPDHTLE